MGGWRGRVEGGGRSCGGAGQSPGCQTDSLQSQLPRMQRLAESQGQHGGAGGGHSQSTNHTLLAQQLKRSTGNSTPPSNTDSEQDKLFQGGKGSYQPQLG